MSYDQMDFLARRSYIDGLLKPGRTIQFSQPFLAGNPTAELTIVSVTKKEVTYDYKGQTITKYRKTCVSDLAQSDDLIFV